MKTLIIVIGILLFISYLNYTEMQRFEIKQNLEVEKSKLHTINLEKSQKTLIESLKTKVKCHESSIK